MLSGSGAKRQLGRMQTVERHARDRCLGETATSLARSVRRSSSLRFASITFKHWAMSWSDGGARAHEIVVPADPLVLTAHYEPVPAPGSG